MKAGLDLEMPVAWWMTREHLVPAVKNGAVTMATIDDKIRRLLRLAFSFGGFDRPQKDTTLPQKSEASAAVALDVARRF